MEMSLFSSLWVAQPRQYYTIGLVAKLLQKIALLTERRSYAEPYKTSKPPYTQSHIFNIAYDVPHMNMLLMSK
jgi:hypothetical protein